MLLFPLRTASPVTAKESRIAKSQDELPVRRMSDSYQEAVIPLGSDPKVTEKYINFYKSIRFGRILEDLDTFAGRTHTIRLPVHHHSKMSPPTLL